MATLLHDCQTLLLQWSPSKMSTCIRIDHLTRPQPLGLISIPTRQRRSLSKGTQVPQRRRMFERVTMSVLESARSESTKRNSFGLNPAEALLERFTNAPQACDVSNTEAADRLFLWEDVPKLAEKQAFSVYELNEFNRDSPAQLEFSRQTVNKVDPRTGEHIHALGDQVQFTNTVYDGSLKMRLGITAGICLLMKHYPGKGSPEMHQLPYFVPDHYETIMTWYLGDMGHICGQGPFINFQDTVMSITGGAGFFSEARGVVRLHNLTPFKFFYTFTLTGIPKLPKQLTCEVVPPTIHVTAHPDAAACKTGFTLPNYND